MAGVELGAGGGPRTGGREGECGHATPGRASGQNRRAVKQLDCRLSAVARAHLNGNSRRVDAGGCHADAVWQHVACGQDPQPDGTVDARAGVPAAVGLIGVQRLNLQEVPLSHADRIGDVQREARVTVVMRAHDLAVDANGCIVVDALELEEDAAALVQVVDLERALVEVVSCSDPPQVLPGGSPRLAGVPKHGIVGNVDRLCLCGKRPFRATGPAIAKLRTHGLPPPCAHGRQGRSSG